MENDNGPARIAEQLRHTLDLLRGLQDGVTQIKAWPGMAGVTCSQAGALALAKILFIAMIANQSTTLLSPQPEKARR